MQQEIPSQHTPGPWKQNDHPDRHNQLYIRLGDGGANAIVERKDKFGKVTDEDIANARLIAAAPDLLLALRNIEEEMMGLIAVAKMDDETHRMPGLITIRNIARNATYNL